MRTFFRWPTALLACGLMSLASAVLAQTTAQMAEDLRVFRREVFEVDRAYTPLARRQAEQQLDQLAQRLDQIDPLRLSLALSRVLALADNGHTLTFAGPRSRRTNRIPVRLLPFASARGGPPQWVVVRARADWAHLLGATLVAIEGRPIDGWRRLAHTLVGGPANWRDRWVPALLESPEQLHALRAVPNPSQARYTFTSAQGRRMAVVLTAEPPGPHRVEADSQQWLLPEPLPGEEGWQSWLPPDRAPDWLREATQLFRLRCDAEQHLLVLEARATSDRGEQKVAAFVDRANAALSSCAPRHVVLDLRLNTGGDLNTLREFAQQLPSRVPGQLFVLTSPWTFSAAISTAGYLKQAGGARTVLVGEPLGDRLEFFAEGRVVWLPHSGDAMLPATERHDYRGGCQAFSDCHEPVVRHPIQVRSLAPDLPVPLTAARYAEGRDPVMEAVQRRISRQGR